MSALALPSSPFKGLVPYFEGDARFFFGREREREIISTNLIASRLTLLYGASGVGKSSVLHAGVVHHLRERARENLDRYATPEFAVISFREWRDNPVRALTQRVHQSLGELLGDRAPPRTPEDDSLVDTLDRWSEHLNCDLLVILDQFEEYFFYHPEDGNGGFAGDFVRALNRADLRANFLVALREDELAKLDCFKGRIPNLFDSYLRIEHLDQEAARAAIEKPIEEYNQLLTGGATRVSIESKLIDAVLDQVRTGQVSLNKQGTGAGLIAKRPADDRIETPYLQLVMNRLWAEDGYGRSGCLRRATLDRLGGAASIVRTHLDLAMDTLSPEEREVGADVFHHLVTPSGTKIVHSVSDLSEYTGRSYAAVMSVLTRLSGGDVRILRPVAAPANQPDTSRFEIFHDALAAAILDWRARFTKKLEEAAQERKLRDAREQAERQLSQERVAHEAELARTRAASERQRADAAQQLAETERHARIRQRRFTIALAVALVLAMGLFAWAWNESITADKLRREAYARELAANAMSALPEDPELGLRLAQEAKKEADKSAITEADDALRQSLASSHVRVRLDAGPVEVAAFSADGRYVVSSGGGSKVATIRDIDAQSADRPLVGHNGPITSLVFSPDGTRVATASEDQTVRVWDAASGSARAILTGHQALVTSVAFNPDGSRIITASLDKIARVWDAATGRPLATLAGHTGALNTAAFSPDSLRIVTASDDGMVRVWNAASGTLVKALLEPVYAKSAAFNHDGTRVVIASSNGKVRIRDARTGARLAELPARGRADITAVALSDDQQLLFTANDLGDGEIWELGTFTRKAALHGHITDVATAVFSPDHQSVLVARADGSVQLWQINSGEVMTQLRGHKGTVIRAAFKADGTRVVTASRDGTVRAWIPNALEQRADLRPYIQDEGVLAKFSRDGSLLLTTSADGTAWVWDARSSSPLGSLRGHRITNADFSRDGAMVTTGEDGTLRVWDARSGRPIKSWQASDRPLGSVAFSPDGKWILTSDPSEAVRVWDARSGQKLTELTGHTKALVSIAFSPDGTRVVTASDDGTARVWQAGTWKSISTLRGHEGKLWGAEFSPDGTRVITGSNDDLTVRVWNASTGQPQAVLCGHRAWLTSAVFSPDGAHIVTSSWDGTGRVWNSQTADLLFELRGHRGTVHSAEFSPDGKWLLTASSDHTARLWNALNGKNVLELHEHGELTNATFSPNGALIVTTGEHGMQIYSCEMCRSDQKLGELAEKRPKRELTKEEQHQYLHAETER